MDENSLALPGATISINKNKTGLVSDVSGAFEFKGLCEGNYSIEIKFLGYLTQEVKINLKKDFLLIVNLKQEEKLLNEVIVEDRSDQITPVSNYGQLTARDLEETKGKSLGEALRNITGVNTIQSGPAIFKPVIHGVHSQRILILNNGIRQEGQQWGAEHAPEIDPFIASNASVPYLMAPASLMTTTLDAMKGSISGACSAPHCCPSCLIPLFKISIRWL